MKKLDKDKIRGEPVFPLSEPIVEKSKPKVKIKQVPTTCHTGKLSYPTAEDAERATKLLKKKHKGGTKWYKCEFCGNYHLTSIKKQRKGKMRF